MNIIQAVIFGAMVSVAIIATAFFLRKKKSSKPTIDKSAQGGVVVRTDVPTAPEIEVEVANELLIGADPNYPALRIAPLTDESRFAQSIPSPLEGGLAGRLNAALQAAPTLLTKGELASGRKYMEVVINGDLVRSSNGDGYRAFTMGPKGIKEHAVLNEPHRLQNFVNAAALWQVASVAVAQQHLADISAKLDKISESVNRIDSFLTDARRSQIVATHSYLRQAAEAIRAGELSDALRNQLEGCERDLLTAFEHLVTDFRSEAIRDVKHSETLGTETLASDLNAKQQRLERLADELSLCIKTRVLAWYVWSVYPGEPNFKSARKASIEKCVTEFKELNDLRADALKIDLDKVKSMFNFGSTLEERKKAIASQSEITKLVLDRNQRESNDELSRSINLLLKHDQPMPLVVELYNGRLGEVRMLKSA